MATLSAAALRESSLLTRCMTAWAQSAKGSAPHRQAMATRINNARAKHQLLMLGWVCNAWREWAVQRKLHYWALHRANGHHRQSVLLVALAAWKTGVGAIILRRKVLHVALQHWRINRLRSCMHGWHAWAVHACWEQCAPPPPAFVSMNKKSQEQHMWPACRRAMGKALLHRLSQLRMHGLEAFTRNSMQRKWERAELEAAQVMHASMLMEMCTKHLTSLWQSKLQFDIGRRTKALADGLKLAAPYAMHWLLKTRHRLQSSRAVTASRGLGQENRSGNCMESTRQEPVERMTLLQHKYERPTTSGHSASFQGSGSSHANMGQRRQVRFRLKRL